MSLEVNRWHREMLRQRQLIQREMTDELALMRADYEARKQAVVEGYYQRLRSLALEPQPATANMREAAGARN